MKPLVIIPPAPARWPPLRDMLAFRETLWLHDLERRLTTGVPDAQDAIALIQDGGLALACAALCKAGDIGTLVHVYTRPEHRRRGHGAAIVQALLAWFDMTGGQWLFHVTSRAEDEAFLARLGFKALHRAPWTPADRSSALRGPGSLEDFVCATPAPPDVRSLTRADWPHMVALLQHVAGPDPRMTLDESAVTAELFTLDLLAQQDKQRCRLLGAFSGARLLALATLAIDTPPPRTYAMVIPHRDAPQPLRDALHAAAGERGYAHVDFPLEASPPQT